MTIITKLSIPIAFSVTSICAKAQQIQAVPDTFKCLSQTTFRTDSLGNRKEKLAFPLTFLFYTDSLIVGNSLNLARQFMSFKIIKKEACQWNDDFTIGKTSYQLIVFDRLQMVKRPKLNIIYEPSGKRYIELLYENGEERIFTIAPQQTINSNPIIKE